MNTQTVFEVGNTQAVALPKSLRDEMGIVVGQMITIERIGETDNLLIRTKPHQKKSTKGAQKDFQKWLSQFLEEDKELLVELLNR